VIAALGGLVQVNPIWIYGPFDPTAALPGAQPDWYLGWAEGALRLFPGVNLRLGGRLVPEVFFPGVLLTLGIFVVAYAYPFLERRFAGDQGEHHVLQRPSEHPLRTAAGMAAFAFLLVLFLAGGQDVITVITRVPLAPIRTTLRVLVLVAPVVVALVTLGACRWRRGRR
jgi:ubiquinol-cytochrome c reductase cytochrome b subunit